MAVPTVNITIEKGTYFENTFYINNDDETPYDLVNYTASAKIRKHPGSSSYQSFNVFMSEVNGLIRLTMTPDITLLLSEGRNYYDVIITYTPDPIYVIKVIEGSAMVVPSISS